MKSAKEAVASAVHYLQEMYGESIDDVLLEEIESTPSGNVWEVTLSFVRPTPAERVQGSIGIIFGENRLGRRNYKVVRVDAESGNVLSMKMWKDAKQS